MAWPSGTKAGTTNVDQGSDLISNARADIKQNIDNVNDIIDHLNISSPSDGDLLQYSSSSGKWEQIASTSVGAPNTALIQFDSYDILAGVTGSFSFQTDKIFFTEIIDNSNIVTINSDSASEATLTLASGKYWITFYIQSYTNPGGSSTASLTLTTIETDSAGEPEAAFAWQHQDGSRYDEQGYLDTAINDDTLKTELTWAKTADSGSGRINGYIKIQKL